MSKNYYRVKKCRFLKKQNIENSQSLEDSSNSRTVRSDNANDVNPVNNIINVVNSVNIVDSVNSEDSIDLNINNDVISNDNEPSDLSSTETEINSSVNVDVDDDNISFEDDDLNVLFEEKIRQWTLKNLDTLRLKVVSELLVILRGEGHASLPKTAEALLNTKHNRVLKVMTSNKKTNGEYIYLGIENGLKNIISPSIFVKETISVLVHIDGMQVYNTSQMQLWPITIKVHHDNYITQPFAVALYCGDSKPRYCRDFFHDFVNEAKQLIQYGVILHTKNYNFEIIALIADAPARCFLKCCKPPGSFYACERCITEGESVGEKGRKKRIYPEMDCELRTKQSFIQKEDFEHHQQGIDSTLLDLPGFDPIKSVVLDSMHILYLGVVKTLMEFWIKRKSSARLKRAQITELRLALLTITPYVPCEFQRRQFDINIFTRWKATQYRFFLLYCGGIFLKDLLSKKRYKHLCLLITSCRLLHSKEHMINNNDDAKGWLRKFFFLLPSLYDEKAQVLSMHDLIHISDDVINVELPLSISMANNTP